MEGEGDIKTPIFRDIRRYFCDYCGICRSKKSLIVSHMLAHHKVCPFVSLFFVDLCFSFVPFLDGFCYS